jgi:hypothetical protein
VLGHGASAATPAGPGRGVAAAGLGRGASATGHSAATAGIGQGASVIGRVDVQIDGDEGLPQGANSTAPAMFNCNGDVRYYREGDEGYVPRFDMADDQFYGLDMNGDSSRFLGHGHSHSRGRSNGHTHARQAPSAVARVRGRGRGRGMNICHTANATMVNGLTSQRSAKNPIDSQVQTFLLTPCPYKFCDALHVFNYKCLLLCIVSYKHFMDYIMLPITQGDSMDWSVPEHVSIVCSLFAEQVQKGNRPNTHLNAVGYAKVSSRFFQITGIELSKTQLKNKWEKLKCDLTAWRKLMRRQTGTGWDHLR